MKYIIDGELLSQIGDAIRKVNGKVTPFTPAQMSSEIEGMVGGGIIDGSMTECIIPERTTDIRAFAFRAIGTLTKVVLPQSLESIGATAFHSTGLTSVIVPPLVTFVGNEAFGGCYYMTEAEVQGNNIGKLTFFACTSLRTLKLTANQKVSIQDDSFNACRNVNVQVPASLLSAYQADEKWAALVANQGFTITAIEE